MLFQKGPSLLSIPLIEQIKNGVHRALNHRTVVVLNVAGQIAVVGSVILRVLGGNDGQRFDCTGHRYVQHPGIIHKVRNDIVHGSQDDGIFLPPLEFMDGSHFQSLAQLGLDRRHLVSVRRDDANTPISLSFQAGKDLLSDHINLSLVQMATGVVAGRCPVHGQDIRFFMVLCHDDEFPAIEFLVAEIDDLGMAAIVFPQKDSRSLWPCSNRRGEQTVGGEMVSLRERILFPDFLAFMDILAVQYIGKLLEIAYNDDIPGAGEGQYTGGQIHLRSLIYDEIIVGMFKVQGALDGVGRAQDYRIFSIEFLGSSPEIPRFKTLAGLLPMELFTQFCPE